MIRKPKALTTGYVARDARSVQIDCETEADAIALEEWLLTKRENNPPAGATMVELDPDDMDVIEATYGEGRQVTVWHASNKGTGDLMWQIRLMRDGITKNIALTDSGATLLADMIPHLRIQRGIRLSQERMDSDIDLEGAA